MITAVKTKTEQDSINKQILESIEKHPAPRKKNNGWLFRHSRRDFILVAIALLHTVGMVVTMLWFAQASLPLLGLIGLTFIALCCTNYQCVAHNFIHNPFFRREWLNHSFAIINSIALGMPQTLYRFHHLNHHKYNSDYRDEKTGKTKDYSSLYRLSEKADCAENIWTYSLLGPFRIDFGILYGIAIERGLAWLVLAETLALGVFYGALIYWNWQSFLVFFVPVLFLGQVAALAENYLEHKGADPKSRLTDSVSCYGSFYNFIWFNNGYHQEHHYRPYVHWTRIQELKANMLPETERRVVRVAHLSNLI